MANKPGAGSDIQCPFYVALAGKYRIVCESPEPGAGTVSLHFDMLTRRQAHVIWHCNEMDGGGCRVYEAIMSKYNDDDKKKEQR